MKLSFKVVSDEIDQKEKTSFTQTINLKSNVEWTIHHFYVGPFKFYFKLELNLN